MEETPNTTRETFDGYVVDIACLRKYPQNDLAELAREHTRECSLMGHCIETGYGLVDGQGRVRLLDSEATPKIVRTLRASSKQAGIQLRASRRRNGREMSTQEVEELP